MVHDGGPLDRGPGAVDGADVALDAGDALAGRAGTDQTRAEIKEIAVRQLAAGGLESVALLRIAKEIGMSGPALYRYFASRDDLLAELVVDAYKAVAAEVQAVDVSAGGRRPLHALATAFRDWAVAQPHLYLLIQGTPVPGFRPPDETLAHARAVLGPFLPVFAKLA